MERFSEIMPFMTVVRHSLVPVILFALAVATQASARTHPANEVQNGTAILLTNEVETVAESPHETSLSDLVRRNAILEAKTEIESAANSRLENYLGAFGILITIVALAFGLSTKEAAVAAARRGVEEETLALKKLVEEAQLALDEIRSHKELALATADEIAHVVEIVRKTEAAVLSNDEAGDRLTSEEKSTLAATARSIEESVTTETEEQMRVVLADAITKRDYNKIIENAVKLRTTSSKVEAKCYSYFAEAWSYEKLEQIDISIKIYEETVEKYWDNLSSLGDVTKMAVNLSILLNHKQRENDVVTLTSRVIAGLAENERPWVNRQIAKALAERAAAHLRLGLKVSALKDYRAILKLRRRGFDDFAEVRGLAEKKLALLKKSGSA